MKKKSLLIFFLLSLITSLLTSCFDLGTFGGDSSYNNADPGDIEEYYKDYYSAIGTISMFTQSKLLKLYSLKDSFFSKSTINELTWEDEDYEVEDNEYIYMAIKVEKTIKLDSLSLYVKEVGDTLSGGALRIYLYVSNRNIFLTVPDYDDEVFIKDEFGNIEYEEDGVTPKEYVYDYFTKDEALGETNVSMAITDADSSAFKSFTIETFSDNADTIMVNAGQYIILSFYNNTGYGREEGLNKINFTSLNLLMRAI